MGHFWLALVGYSTFARQPACTFEGMVIYLSAVLAVAGLLMLGLSANPKVVKIGELTYFAGLLAFLLRLPASGLEILPK